MDNVSEVSSSWETLKGVEKIGKPNNGKWAAPAEMGNELAEQARADEEDREATIRKINQLNIMDRYLKFRIPELETLYTKYSYEEFKYQICGAIWILALVNIVSEYNMAKGKGTDYNIIERIVDWNYWGTPVFILTGLVLLVSKRQFVKPLRWISIFLMIAYFAENRIIAHFLGGREGFGDNENTKVVYDMYVIGVAAAVGLKLDFKAVSIPLFVSGIYSLVSVIFISQASVLQVFQRLIAIVLTIIIVIGATYKLEQGHRIEFFQRVKMAHSNDQLDSILRSLLPENVVSELYTGSNNITHQNDDAACLFASLTIDTENLNERAELFNHAVEVLDQCTERSELYKVSSTIVGTYLAVAGIPDPTIDYETKTIRLALVMISSITKWQKSLKSDMKVSLRIGVKVGPLGGGIIGKIRPYYQVMGDTVNVAARLAMSADEMSVQCLSDYVSSWGNDSDLLKEIVLGEKKLVMLKGKGDLYCTSIRPTEDFIACNSSNIEINLQSPKETTTNNPVHVPLENGSDVVQEIFDEKLKGKQVVINVASEERSLHRFSAKKQPSLFRRMINKRNNQTAESLKMETVSDASGTTMPAGHLMSTLESNNSGTKKKTNIKESRQQSTKRSFFTMEFYNEAFEKIYRRTTVNSDRKDFLDSLKVLGIFEILFMLHDIIWFSVYGDGSEMRLSSVRAEIVDQNPDLPNGESVSALWLLPVLLGRLLIVGMIYIAHRVSKNRSRHLALGHKMSGLLAILIILVSQMMFIVPAKMYSTRVELQIMVLHSIYLLGLRLKVAIRLVILGIITGVSWLLLLYYGPPHWMLDEWASQKFYYYVLPIVLSNLAALVLVVMREYSLRSSMIIRLKNRNIQRLSKGILNDLIPEEVGGDWLPHAFTQMKKSKQKTFNGRLNSAAYYVDQAGGYLDTLDPAYNAKNLDSESYFVKSYFKDVSLVVADIVGFTQKSSTMKSKDLCVWLTKIYSQIDSLCAKNGVYKVDIVGDSFVTMCGAPEPVSSHAERSVEFGLDLLALSQTVKWPDGDQVKMRVGVAKGEVIAGLFGLRRPRYQPFGDTVHVAHFMEHFATPGQLHISAEVKEALSPTKFPSSTMNLPEDTQFPRGMKSNETFTVTRSDTTFVEPLDEGGDFSVNHDDDFGDLEDADTLAQRLNV